MTGTEHFLTGAEHLGKEAVPSQPNSQHGTLSFGRGSPPPCVSSAATARSAMVLLDLSLPLCPDISHFVPVG